jgi:DNA-binding transcriptional regulator GbsR (MarR family)
MDYRNEILKLLRKQPMTYLEIRKYFNLDKSQINNYLASLKKYGLIEYQKEYDQQKNQKYIALDFIHEYSDFVNTYKKEVKPGIEFSPLASMKISSNDYHTKGSQEKRSAWIGTTLGTMEY